MDLQSQLGTEGKNSRGSAIGSSLGGTPSSQDAATDHTQLSQMAVLLSALRLLQQTDPSDFKALLSEMGASLSDEAQGASAAAASMLTQLEGDFTGPTSSEPAPSPDAVSTA